MTDIERIEWTEAGNLDVDEERAAFFQQMVDRGYYPICICRDESPTGYFVIRNDQSRSIGFIFRGIGRGQDPRGHLLEVLPEENDQTIPLGRYFEAEDYDCIVVCGYESAHAVTCAWLEGVELHDLLRVTQFYKRHGLDPVTPSPS